LTRYFFIFGGFAVTTAEERLRMAAAIVDFEARRDQNGKLKVYRLPPEDGGGRYEVAGINERYHKQVCDSLVALIEAGRPDEAEKLAIEYIASYTDAVASWSVAPAIECYLRDSAFNRGQGGAAKILQKAVDISTDGIVGPATRAAVASYDRTPDTLLGKLRASREWYERAVVGRDEASRFWQGLVNRWNKALDIARSFLPDGRPLLAESAGRTASHATAVMELAANAPICEGCGLAERAANAIPIPRVDRVEQTSHQSSRNGTDIDHIVVHYTTSRNIEGTISHFRNGTPSTSAHYIVGRDGALVRMVADTHRAWHAGDSQMNARSIGIEHVAAAGDKITEEQARTSLALIRWLMAEYDIPLEGVIPHVCVRQTSCCGDLFKDFGGGAGLSCEKQRSALHGWLRANGIP
jgi:lysozyme family protein